MPDKKEISKAVMSRISILVVDDDEVVRKTVTLMLNRLGVKSVHQAANGQEGMAAVLRNRPDMVLCDMHMSPMNGVKFVQELRSSAIDEVKKTPVVMLTADGAVETVQSLAKYKIQGYLLKPTTVLQIQERIFKVLGRKFGL
ncbi:MAG: response regulator [Rhodospirillaceae bacterium]